MGDPVLHISLRNATDLLLVCPASADCLSKMAAGQADSFFLSVVRAWDFSKPAIVCPAMNSFMFESPLTSRCCDALRELGFSMVDPVVKTLACQERGTGALASVSDIVATVKNKLYDLSQLSSLLKDAARFPPPFHSGAARVRRLKALENEKRSGMIWSSSQPHAFLIGCAFGAAVVVSLSFISNAYDFKRKS